MPMEEALKGQGFDVRRSALLQDDWDSRDWRLLVNGGAPDLMIMHFSCFREDGFGQSATEERRSDFERFAVTFANMKPVGPDGLPTRLLVFTQSLENVHGKNLTGLVNYAFQSFQYIGDQLKAGRLLRAMEIDDLYPLGDADMRRLLGCVRSALYFVRNAACAGE
jgi:hypothetical protein